MTKLKNSHRLQYGWFQLVDKCFGRKKGAALTKAHRVRLFGKITTYLEKKGPGKITDIERVKDISLKDFQKNYVSKGKPVVIEGGAKHWGCAKEWSLEYFKKLHGDDEITIVANDASEEAFEILKLSEVLDNIREGGKKYFRFYPLLKEHPEHIVDFDYEWLRGAKNSVSYWEQFQVFIGGKGSYTPMHNAAASNIFVQAYGEKEWVIYPPNVTTIIDPEPGINFHRGAPYKTTEGPFNPFKPDYSGSYRLFKHLDGLRVHLKPGDILFNPPHYWHAVQNPTDSIGIGYRWLSPRAAFQTAPWYSFLDCLDAPFNKTLYLHMKKDYNLIHLMEMGGYYAYKAKKEAQNVKSN